MDLWNETPYSIGYLAGRMNHPGHSMTLVVKGTFELVEDAPAKPAAEQLPLAGDEPDDLDGPVGLRYPMDLVPFKPRADALVVGTCHAGTAPASMARVTFQIDDWSKALNVYGDRSAALGAGGAAALFTAMPLGYERSPGGRGDKRNPIGRGLGEDAGRADAGLRPNLEHPNNASAAQRATVPGFGPLRRDWKPRVDLVGTYGAKWKRTRWPWYPEDFDFAHFNVAPADQQRPYLRGDERIALERLVAGMRWWRGLLPGVRVRAFVSAVGEAELRELELALDTLWIDADALKMVLIWRGVMPTAGPDLVKEIGDVMVAQEPLADEPAPQRHYEARLARAKALAEAELAAPDDGPSAAPTGDEPAERTPDPAIAKAAAAEEVEQALEQAESKARKAIEDAGLDPEAVLQPPTPEQIEQQAKRLAEHGIFLPPPPAPRDRGFDRERVAAAAKAGQSMASASLRGLDLSELELDGADFRGATLIDAKLTGTRLRGAQLDGANLAGADLTGAQLPAASLLGADLSRAKLVGADLSEAKLDGAVAEHAVFRGALLIGASAKDLAAPEADLSEANCERADLSGADLAGSRLDRAVLRGARMQSTTLEDAQGEGIDAEQADLSQLRASGAALPGARLSGAKGPESIWERAKLDDADLTLADMRDANFNGASLERAQLQGCLLRNAKFAEANLQASVLVRANLHEALLEGTDLRHADLRDATLFAAETLGAQLDKAQLSGANLKRTKLASGGDAQ